jgi:GNAT superfamily N-acetyltransferase
VIREAVTADREALGPLCERALTLDPDAAALPALLDDRPPQLRLVAVEDDRVVGFVCGSLAGGTGHLDLLVVDPSRLRQGIGTELVTALEATFRTVGATQVVVGAAADRYAWPGVDVRYTPAVCLFDRLGYRQSGEATNMTVDLAQPVFDIPAAEQRLAAAGIEVRRLRADETPAFADWMRQWGGSWPAEAARSAAYPEPRCHVAVQNGDYLGFACHGSNRDSWFGPMGTNEAARGQGVGGVLLARCLADQQAAGFAAAEIGWVGPVSFYSRTVGARIGRVFWFYEKSL